MKSAVSPTESAGTVGRRSLVWTLGCLVLVLGAMFSRSFDPTQILFSSDAPLGIAAADAFAMPGALTGVWQDLNWVGEPAGSASLSLTYSMIWLLGPLGFAKFYAPLSLLALGLAVWFCFRQLGFRSVVCALGSLAAVFNTDFFSYACWGLGSIVLTIAWTFLALAALMSRSVRPSWIRAALAGFAVGMAVMEGFDVGAILSLFVAAFVLYQAWWEKPDDRPADRAARGIGRLALVVVMAGFIAAHMLTVLIGTQLKGIVGMDQDQATKQQRWDLATQWSLPKLETLRVVIPGLFGYRMDTPGGGNYWGRVGESPGNPGTRHSGSGVYGGLLVVVVSLWGFLQSLRRGGKSLLRPDERRMVWFWSGALLVSLLLSWGRHAPFYQVVYALPYFSTIRNPVKFMHPFSIALVVVFGYSLNALIRHYLEGMKTGSESLSARFRQWWRGAAVFDRRWTAGCLIVIGVTVVCWLMYAGSLNGLERRLGQLFPAEVGYAADLGPQIARFSLLEVGWFLLFFSLTVGLLLVVFSGSFAGARARWAVVCLGALMVADFTRANAPWVYYWAYREKYAPNALTRFLGHEPWKHRFAIFPPSNIQQLAQLDQIYRADWLQHGFRYYNIQSLDLVQEPRRAVDNAAYRAAMGQRAASGVMRMWQLTNTRYLLGLTGQFVDVGLNQQLDPVQQRFRQVMGFTFSRGTSPNSLVIQTNVAGPFALIEFTGALPRASLYANWRVNTNDTQTLDVLTDPGFDPSRTVLVSDPIDPPASGATNAPAGTVEFASYAPKRVVLKAQAARPSVLLLNDKFDPGWEVRVDGERRPLLRCNFLMRGVLLEAGEHEVTFTFSSWVKPLAISMVGILGGIGLLAFASTTAGRSRDGDRARGDRDKRSGGATGGDTVPPKP